MHRIEVVADGFNLYHSIRDALRVIRLANVTNRLHNKPLLSEQMKWLDLRAVAESYQSAIRQEIGEPVQIGNIFYYSALAKHEGSSHIGRHMDYLSAITLRGVEVCLSRFKCKKSKCRHCSRFNDHYVEKETDVAVASKVLEIAAKQQCDSVFLLSGDTDLIPALKTARRINPNLKLLIAFPYDRDSVDMRKCADLAFAMDTKLYRKWQMPDSLELPNGDLLARPTGW